MVTLLPEPDSPTTPSTSPSSRVRLTPSTARKVPPADGNSTERFWMSRSGMGALTGFSLGVEGIAQAVPDEVEGEHGDQDDQAREGHHPPGPEHELAGVGQHRTPSGEGGWAPRPRKPRAAASRIAVETPSEAWR